MTFNKYDVMISANRSDYFDEWEMDKTSGGSPSNDLYHTNPMFTVTVSGKWIYFCGGDEEKCFNPSGSGRYHWFGWKSHCPWISSIVVRVGTLCWWKRARDDLEIPLGHKFCFDVHVSFTKHVFVWTMKKSFLLCLISVTGCLCIPQAKVNNHLEFLLLRWFGMTKRQSALDTGLCRFVFVKLPSTHTHT